MAAVFLYGSNFVPVKRVETGDGEHIIVYFSESLDILICVIFGQKLHFKCLLSKWGKSTLFCKVLRPFIFVFYLQVCFFSGLPVQQYGLYLCLETWCFSHPSSAHLQCLEVCFGPQVLWKLRGGVCCCLFVFSNLTTNSLMPKVPETGLWCPAGCCSRIRLLIVPCWTCEQF